MSAFFSNDFKSELTVGKISAKILVAICVGVGWYFIQNLYEFIPGIYKSISQSLYDRMLVSIAHGPKNYDASLMTIALSFMSFFLVLVTLGLVQAHPFIERKNSSKSEEISYNPTEFLSTLFKFFKPISTIIFFVTVILSVIVQLGSSKIEAEAEIRREFNRKIVIITPYVDEKIKDKIISDFALMKEEKDYLKINSTFESIFKRYKLKP